MAVELRGDGHQGHAARTLRILVAVQRGLKVVGQHPVKRHRLREDDVGGVEEVVVESGRHALCVEHECTRIGVVDGGRGVGVVGALVFAGQSPAPAGAVNEGRLVRGGHELAIARMVFAGGRQQIALGIAEIRHAPGPRRGADRG